MKVVDLKKLNNFHVESFSSCFEKIKSNFGNSDLSPIQKFEFPQIEF